jgi:hypothetical protein
MKAFYTAVEHAAFQRLHKGLSLPQAWQNLCIQLAGFCTQNSSEARGATLGHKFLYRRQQLWSRREVAAQLPDAQPNHLKSAQPGLHFVWLQQSELG